MLKQHTTKMKGSVCAFMFACTGVSGFWAGLSAGFLVWLVWTGSVVFHPESPEISGGRAGRGPPPAALMSFSLASALGLNVKCS